MKTESSAAVKPFDLVIFGGSGDLTMRKLLPSLYYHHRDGLLPPEGRIIGVARHGMSRKAFVNFVNEQARQHIVADEFDEATWNTFTERLDYISLDVTESGSFKSLAAKLAKNPAHSRIYYLSTAPGLFALICQQLAEFQLAGATARVADIRVADIRVAVEKPLGHDLDSARAINACIGGVFQESQIYRIDHYLGKEPVQNLLALRFGNALFEPLWNRAHIRDVQITIAEQLGIGSRGEFYDQTGALRDMLQNHLLQLLCIIAMEPPIQNTPDAVRDEKLKVLRALRPLAGQEALANSVRGQYRSGAIAGEVVPSYLDEQGVRADSNTETFVALKAQIDNWRWAGVPFFLRTGKRMQERVTEIVINFERLPHAIFDTTARASSPNRLVIRLQPEEYIRLSIRAKAPGDAMILRPVELNLDLKQAHKERQHSAYERLLIDLLRGQQTLFVRHDELEAAWRWIDPILDSWASSDEAPAPYPAGTWGPASASRLIYEHQCRWHEDS